MTDTQDHDGPRTPGRHYSARYHLLDRQVVHPDGTSVCKVDDLELTPGTDGHLYATAVLVGPQALGPRLGGRIGRWCTAIAARLSLSGTPGPGRLPLERITHIGSALVCTPGPDRLHALEDWTRAHLIDRILGAGRANR